jgi:hypothetical protein
VLVVFIAPPFLLAPVITALIRRRWLFHLDRTAPLFRTLLALGTLEFLLWLAAARFAAVVYFQGKWGATLALGAIMAAILALDRRLGAPHRSWLFSLAFMSVFPGVWVILQPFWYWCVLLWERIAA